MRREEPDDPQAGLAHDVRWLGDTLGHVIRDLEGEDLFEAVEGMRVAAKRAREDGDPVRRREARSELQRWARSMDALQAKNVAHAFTLYFQLVNLAEDVHRVRELRRRELQERVTGTAESLPAVLVELKRAGADRTAVREVLEAVALTFVFTAHPTEARRRTTERLLARVREVLAERDRATWTPSDAVMGEARLRAAVEALWQHGPERGRRPEVIDEVKTGLWYFRHVLFDAVPAVQRRLHLAFREAFGDVDAHELPVPLGFGSWMGADRDGNPFVTDEVTEETLELQRALVLERYLADLDALVDPLAASEERLPADQELRCALDRAAAAVPEARAVAAERNPQEPLRRLLTYVRERLERTRQRGEGGYAAPAELLQDLHVMRTRLRRSGARALADGTLLDTMIRIRCFGFHLASLDVREDARVHRRVIGELLGRQDYPRLDPQTRLRLLEGLAWPSSPSERSQEAQRLLSSFEHIGHVQRRFGPEALHTYAISHCASVADVVEVVRLAELAGVASSLDFVPLLEDRDALYGAGDLMDALMAHPTYRTHLRARGDVQELLVGYSDSMKEAGILSSRVAVRHAQRQAAAHCVQHGVTLRIFHGRGGSVSRGGGPTYRAIRALARDAFSGCTKITEQGEVRSFHFGDPELSVRYLEQTLGAALTKLYEARGLASGSAPDDLADTSHGQLVMEQLAREGERTYGRLVRDPDTLRYFVETTPLKAIADLNIASRPASRSVQEEVPDLESLRAIPWVFAWSQSRMVLTGWYGVGTALEWWSHAHGRDALRRLHEGSRFFRDLLDAVQMTLAKADMPIAERYARLCDDRRLCEKVYGRARREFERTRAQLLALTGEGELLEDDPVLQRSIRLRNPYVDPLSYLQVEALGRGPDADAWNRLVRATVQGIAAGLRNTG